MARIANPLEELSLEDLRHRTSVKWRTYPHDVLPLWVAEMDVRLAEPIAAALTRAIERGDTGYPAGRGLAEAYAGFAARRWGWKGVDPANTALVPDVMLGIVEVIRLLTSPGDSVIVSAPVYPPFFAFVEHDQRHIRQAPCDDAGRLDLTALDRAFGEARADGRAAVYLMSNPHNPTGVVHSRTELEQVAALARHHGVRVISDEIHSPLALPGADVVPFLSVAGAEDSFAVVSASKAWNLAGLKTGLVVAGPGAAADLRRLPEEVGHGASHLGVIAHTTAFEEGEPWLDALLAGLADNRTLVGELVGARHPWIGLRPPEGTYLAWLDCRPLGLHDAAVDGAPGVVTELAGPARFFLDHARVALSSGHVFGSGGAGHVRLNFATSRTILTEALDRMSRALEASGPVPRRDR